MRKQTKWIGLIMGLLMLLCSIPAFGAAKTQNIKNSVLEFLRNENPAPEFGAVGGDWVIVCLARAGAITGSDRYATAYTARVTAKVRETAPTISGANGALHRSKSTENARLILALTSIGVDPHNVGGWDLFSPYADFDWIRRQGINGVIFALLALDAHDDQTVDASIRSRCLETLLSAQTPDGGWTLAGTSADADLTAMALQALARYRNQEKVRRAAERGFDCLSALQGADGDFTGECETLAQVVIACAAWGRDPDTDAAVKKSHGSAWSALRTYLLPDGSFCHKHDGGFDEMATEQAGCAIVAYDRFLNGDAPLYDMRAVRLNTQDDTPQTKPSSTAPATSQTPQTPAAVPGTTVSAQTIPGSTMPGSPEVPATAQPASGFSQSAVQPAVQSGSANVQTPSGPKTGDNDAAVIAAAIICAASTGLLLLTVRRRKKEALK